MSGTRSIKICKLTSWNIANSIGRSLLGRYRLFERPKTRPKQNQHDYYEPIMFLLMPLLRLTWLQSDSNKLKQLQSLQPQPQPQPQSQTASLRLAACKCHCARHITLVQCYVAAALFWRSRLFVDSAKTTRHRWDKKEKVKIIIIIKGTNINPLDITLFYISEAWSIGERRRKRD